jgi:diacylglycerol kinase (ATP)
MTNQKNSGFKRILNASRFSWQGLKTCFANEAAFRQEILLTLVLAPLGLWLGQGAVEKALLVFVLLLVPVVELLNSAIEALVDRFGDEIHQLSGRAKDMASAAVFVSLLNLVVVWALVLLV